MAAEALELARAEPEAPAVWERALIPLQAARTAQAPEEAVAQMQAAALRAPVSVAAPYALLQPQAWFLPLAQEAVAAAPALSVLPFPESRRVLPRPPSEVLSRQLLPHAAPRLQPLQFGASFAEYPPAGPRRCWSATLLAHPCVAAHVSLRSCRGSARERAHRLEVSLP
jgi:hypothetical protein